MGDAQWETCGAETLLEEFFAQDDLRQLAESAGKILDCPLLVLDDTPYLHVPPAAGILR